MQVIKGVLDPDAGSKVVEKLARTIKGYNSEPGSDSKTCFQFTESGTTFQSCPTTATTRRFPACSRALGARSASKLNWARTPA